MTFKIPFAAATGILMGLSAQPVPREISIDSGPYDRRGTVVSFSLKAAKPTFQYALLKGKTSIPLQLDPDGRAWFVMPFLKAGTTQTFHLAEISSAEPTVVATRTGDSVAFAIRGPEGAAPVLQYVGGEGVLPSADIKPIFKRGGYLHPVRTPSGRIVTDDYPADHRHHHGIWFAWTKTMLRGEEPDFWNVGQGKARVEFEALKDVWSGRVHAGLHARHRYVDLTSGSPVTVLSEQWHTRVFARGGDTQRYQMFDVEVAQTNVATEPLLLPEYHYGGIGVRGAASFVHVENVQVLTSEGKDRLTGDGTESRWVVMSGGVDGQRASLAILAHPSNFRAPERMRIHPTDPYLCYAPSRSGPWAIAKGATHTARYRFVSFDGLPDAAELQRLWVDYAQPPEVNF